MTHVAGRHKDWLSRIDLKTRLIIFSVLPINILLLTAFLYGLYAVENATEKTMQEDLELIARTIKDRVEQSVIDNNLEDLSATLESVFQFRRVYGVLVYNNQGAPIWKLGAARPDESRTKLRILAEKGVETGEYGHTDRREVYSFFLPLVDPSGQGLGLLQLTRKRDDMRSVLSSVRRRSIALMIVVLSLSSGALIFADRIFLQKPVKQLRSAMASAASGKLETRVQLHCPPELQSIGVGLNEMLERLEAAQKETQQEKTARIELKKELKRAERLAIFGQFAAGIAHDVGTPLSVIDGMANRALRRMKNGTLSNEAKPIFSDIAEETRKMDAILRQLLDFARGTPTTRQSILFKDVLTQSLATIQPIAREKRVDLKTLDTDDCDFCYELHGDETQLQQAFVNILKNAIEAARSKVLLSATKQDHKIVFAIHDDGKGIETDAAEKIFEPFFTNKARGTGAGLGLAVAHGIVAEHGGSIAVEDSHLGGACFEVQLDLRRSGVS